MCRHERPIAVSTVIALSPAWVCPAPPADQIPGLAHAYAVSGALEEAYLLAQITRLGRLNARERICDLFLEFLERLSLCGTAYDGEFDLPLTQETLGDALGLTPVHINRTLQQLRASGDIEWRGRRVTIRRPEALARQLGRSPVAVQSQAEQ
jgi:CRP-like cAMP-binding protein